jgi:glutamine synthetase
MTQVARDNTATSRGRTFDLPTGTDPGDLHVGMLVDLSGVTRAKAVPQVRRSAFAGSGIGASPTWMVFCLDNGIVFTDDIGVTGDLRLRADLERTSILDEHLTASPVVLSEQDGTPSPLCPRTRLQSVSRRVAEAGLQARMGIEIEFTVLDPAEPATTWACYGMRSLIARQDFLRDLAASLTKAGLPPEQLHAEWGTEQYEVSFAPSDPVAAADAAVLARSIMSVVAHRHGLALSLSPMPFADGAANGAHLHLSFARDGANVFAGGSGPHGLRPEGGSAIAGVLQALPELLGVYAGSVISAARLRSGSWSGASACWGLENREAAVRLLAGTPGNPHGANIELKVVDPSANVYLAAAAMLGSALAGIEHGAELPAEVLGDPAALGLPPLPRDHDAVLDALESSQVAAELLGAQIVAGLVAVRRYEQSTFGALELPELCAVLRSAWS